MDSLRKDEKVRYLLATPERKVPLYVDSIGYNPEQERVERPDGYPCWHWLQSVSGEGEIDYNGTALRLGPNQGILFMPNAAHRYGTIRGGEWSTLYLTFDGPVVPALLEQLELVPGVVYSWEDEVTLGPLLVDVIRFVSTAGDITGFDHSVELYRFLVALTKHGITNNRPSVHSLAERMAPVVQYLEQEYADPDLSTEDMAACVGISPRRLNTLFRQVFGCSPYQYLIALRVRRAKQMLTLDSSLTVHAAGTLVGFRDPSHFIATFRKLELMTPDEYRRMNGKADR